MNSRELLITDSRNPLNIAPISLLNFPNSLIKPQRLTIFGQLWTIFRQLFGHSIWQGGKNTIKQSVPEKHRQKSTLVSYQKLNLGCYGVCVIAQAYFFGEYPRNKFAKKYILYLHVFTLSNYRFK
uniref:Uncharacterized protein n=1 Tax=Cacopsylla melanoneura TaxID=428564 RepID=A0A8D8QS31_9HEMI